MKLVDEVDEKGEAISPNDDWPEAIILGTVLNPWYQTRSVGGLILVKTIKDLKA